MREFKFNTSKVFKVALICYAIVFLAGIAFSFIFGVNFDVNFRGGTKIAYKYTGEIEISDVEETVKTVIDKDFSVTKSSSVDNSSKTFEITLIGKNALTDEEKQDLNRALKQRFGDSLLMELANTEDAAVEDATIENTAAEDAAATEDTAAEDTAVTEDTAATENAAAEDSAAQTDQATGSDQRNVNETSVNPSLAGTFFLKSLVAVLLTAVLVIIYVGIRFRKIGGVSAAVTALCALILDLLVTFCVCILFRLQIDSNYIAVILTILGYSLNDTIVVYDRVRENRRLTPDMEIGELVDKSINAVKIRNFVTTLTTFLAVMTIVVVSELYGLTSLRTFAIPMAFGLISGCISSLFIAGPLWVKWRVFSAARKEAKAARPKKAKKA